MSVHSRLIDKLKKSLKFSIDDVEFEF